MNKQYSTIGTVGVLLLLCACSPSRYTYNFDHYDYNSGRKSAVRSEMTESKDVAEPLKLDEKNLLASTSPQVVEVTESKALPTSSLKLKAERYKEMSKQEKKEFRKEFRKTIKDYSKQLKASDEGASVAATKELDDELKLAIIFGAVGITLTVLGGINTIFWVLGVVSLIVGLVFFIRWISTQ